MADEKYILIVEDDRDVREVLAEVLGDEGFRVVATSNGLEALTHLRKNPPPFLILLDLMMPVMSGTEFRAQQVQDSKLSAIPVLVLTAVDSGWQGNAVFAGCGFLRKPLDLDTLIAQVRARLES